MILEALEKNGSPLPEFETDENHDYFITRLFVRDGFYDYEPETREKDEGSTTPKLPPALNRRSDAWLGISMTTQQRDMAFSELESEGRIAAVQVEGIKAPLYMLTEDIIMKEKIDITDYANLVTRALPKGILLNTNGEKFNSMVIGWGHIGTLWGRPTFHVYVRQGRYTKGQLDKTGEFTVSVPLDKADPSINRICGWQSGHNIDKVKEAGLKLEDAQTISTPGVKQYPLTIECRVLYAQDQELSKIPEDIREKMYPRDVDGSYPMANRDFHTMYVGEIVDAYIIR